MSAVYDCFTFFNELELLELRLHELAGVVDKFVLVEATRTHSNKPKPLHYRENRDRFAKFHEKIIHVVVDDLPDDKDAWVLENFQRNCIERGLSGCRPDDLVMISDLDEIPRASAVITAREQMHFRGDPLSNLAHNALNSQLVDFIARSRHIRRRVQKHHPFILKFEQTLYRYFMNCQSEHPPCWFGTRILYFRDFSSAQLIRHSGFQVVKNGGWHFSFMGGVERIREKLDAFAHQERNIPEFTDTKKITELINCGGLNFRKNWRVRFVPVDDTFPLYFLRHPEIFSPWIKPIEGQGNQSVPSEGEIPSPRGQTFSTMPDTQRNSISVRRDV
jgi:beta-1,4-mannosyl-glycoprotein beta-1,4-N-acetylglucosaminyltransferase